MRSLTEAKALIFVLEENETPALTGQSVSQVQSERKRALNVQGRGHAFHLKIRHTDKTKRLVDALGKAWRRR
jgi:hypothetical protein